MFGATGRSRTTELCVTRKNAATGNLFRLQDDAEVMERIKMLKGLYPHECLRGEGSLTNPF